MSTSSHYTEETKSALLQRDVDTIKSDVKSIKDSLLTQYVQSVEMKAVQIAIAKLEITSVTQEQFKPVRVIVYGMVGLILTSVVGAMLTVVLVKGL